MIILNGQFILAECSIGVAHQIRLLLIVAS
jgi:hypothetical protein